MPWTLKKTSLAVFAALAGTSGDIAQAQIDVPISMQRPETIGLRLSYDFE